MAGTVYALLVGIDKYLPPVTPLRGCVTDIEAMHSYLASRVGREGCRLDAIVLRNEEAKRQVVIDNFVNHLGKAGPEDVALFYYSGHGSQAQTAPEFFHLEPDRLDETLVCYDSRTSGNYDLADKELSKLIADLATRDPHVVVILDSCHSGSATRNLDSVGVRRVATDDRQRPVSSYLITPSELEELGATRSVTAAKSAWTRLPQGRHIVLSACQSDEEAKEIPMGDQTRGVFSYFLMETLQSATTVWTYRDLFARVNSLVRAKVSRQSPLIEATNFDDLDRPFLGGTIQTQAPYFMVSFDRVAGWIIDGGAIHGIPAVQGDETTHLALYLIEVDNLEEAKNTVGEVRVIERQPTRSKVAITLNDSSQPNKEDTYKAVVTALPIPPLGVCMQGDDAAIKLVREAMAVAAPNGEPSLLVREVEDGEELRLIAHDDCYQIRRAGDDRPLSAVVEGWSVEKAGKAVEYLEHIARWMHMADLFNPASKLLPNAVSMDLFLVDAEGKETHVDVARQGKDLVLHYDLRNDEWYEPEFKLRLTNTSNRRLYCALYDLTDRFKIWAENLLPGGGIWLDPKEETWAYNGDPMPASVPNELWSKGMSEYKDLLKLIASTEWFDATKFQQDNLDVKYEIETTRGGSLSSLEQLMKHALTREIGESQRSGKFADWMTSELSITTIRPLDGASLPAPGKSVSLAPQLTLQGHTGLKANVRLTTIPLASRDMTGAPQLPAWLRDDPTLVQPLDLSPSRSAEAGLSVLELTEVSNHTAVTPDQPLRLHVDAKLIAEDHLLPVAYDPESDLFLPLGRTLRTDAGVEIQIERLPAPASSRRSLTGSIKIFFQKIICKTLGFGFEYPLLGSVDAEGNYTSELGEIRARVDKAKRILLYVHGIIGDTREMATSAFNPRPDALVTALGMQYDLVLTFDYENLNTQIQDNARALKQRLEQVGLAANHGKTLHVVAHSMGGLVSRWFIEREGGNAVVQHLVMLGTPNAGSPWGTVEDWVTGAIGLGLNGLTAVGWPVKVLAGLMSAFEKAAGASLEQMEVGSPLLQDLAASPDPGVRYTIVAGNTSILTDALHAQEGEAVSRVRRLFEKLNLKRVLHATASLAFFGQPNDIAVAVNSITGVPAFEKVDPPREVACDHMTYFSTEAGLQALGEVLT